jgi:hypothetical protein
MGTTKSTSIGLDGNSVKKKSNQPPRNFGTIQEYRQFYFPREVAAERERLLLENPGEWGRQKAIESIEKHGALICVMNQ